MQQLAEQVARNSYGRLLAILASRTKDIAAAEDALSDAFLAALRTWPEQGIPAKPDAWLIAVARNGLLNTQRHHRVQQNAQQEIELRYQQSVLTEDAFPDERLKLLFVCAHPAIDPAIRAPLMLQTVLGLDAKRIGAAFLIPAATMGQRLVRAKSKIRDSGLRFEIATREEMPARLDDVLAAIYAAYGSAWDAIAHPESTSVELSQEAIYLARLLVELLPTEPEARGLLALMLYCEARRPARLDAQGRFVPLQRQNARLWSRDSIIEAEGLLTSASAHGRFGRYQCEAALQSVHVQRGITGQTNYAALRALYDLLVTYSPSLGALVSRAAVLMESGEPQAALAALDALPNTSIDNYQPYWITRAHVLKRLGDPAASQAHRRALELTEDHSLREFLALDGLDYNLA